MKNRLIITVIFLVLGSSALTGVSFGQGHGKHGDAQMKKLHAMMPVFSVALAKLETALEKGDALAVEKEAGKILAALPDLKKSKPHKNFRQRERFVDLAGILETSVNTTVNLARKGNFRDAKESFKEIEGTCAACHATFRDS